MHTPLKLHHRRLGQHSPVHRSAVVGDRWRPDSHLPTPAPYPPLPSERPVRWCALRAPRTNGAAAPHPGTFPGRSQGREALSVRRDPSTCQQRLRPWECGTQLVQHRTCANRQSRSAGPPQSCPAHTRPHTQSWDWRAACLCDQEDTMPWPTTPQWAQRRAPMACRSGPGAPGHTCPPHARPSPRPHPCLRARLHTGRQHLPPTCAAVGSCGCR